MSHHDVGRGKGLGKDAGAAQAGELRLIRLAAQVGAPGALVEDRMAWWLGFPVVGNDFFSEVGDEILIKF